MAPLSTRITLTSFHFSLYCEDTGVLFTNLHYRTAIHVRPSQLIMLFKHRDYHLHLSGKYIVSPKLGFYRWLNKASGMQVDSNYEFTLNRTHRTQPHTKVLDWSDFIPIQQFCIVPNKVEEHDYLVS
jgi:hypothetical protein